MPELAIKETVKDGVTIVAAEGQIRIGEGVTTLRSAIHNLINKGVNRIVVDLGKVSKIDSSGIGELSATLTTAYRHECIIVLARLAESNQDLLVITKLLTIFEVYDTVDQAVEAIKDLSFSDFVHLVRR